MDKFKVLFIPTANAGVNYWRMWNPAVAMHRNGHAETQVLWYDKHDKDLNRWEINLARARAESDAGTQYYLINQIWSWARQSDAIVVGMVHSRAGLDMVDSLIEMRERGHLRDVPIMMELDDNILSVPAYNPAFASYEPGTSIRESAIAQMRRSDGVIVTTPYLKECCGEFNANVHVVHNSIDFELWGKLQNKPKRGVRIGWSGASAHADDLAILENVIPTILNKYPEVTFVFVHCISPMIRRLGEDFPGRLENHTEWTEIEDYPKMLCGLDLDIIMAPLIDSNFNRAKSNLKWIEAGALSIPCVASRVGHFSVTLEDGKDVLFCEPDNAERDFIANLSTMIEHGGVRKKIGKAARAKIFDKFNVDKTSKDYVDVLIKTSNAIADNKVAVAEMELKERISNEAPNESIAIKKYDGPNVGGPGHDEVLRISVLGGVESGTNPVCP